MSDFSTVAGRRLENLSEQLKALSFDASEICSPASVVLLIMSGLVKLDDNVSLLALELESVELAKRILARRSQIGGRYHCE